MPNIKSATKRMHQSRRLRIRNRLERSKIKSTQKKVYEGAAGENKAELKSVYQRYCSIVDKAAKKGIIKKNNAIRRKTRAAKKLGV
jgi:small subunit ribosomal protein S20